MSGNAIAAETYARALFEAASAGDKAPQVLETLLSLQAGLEEDQATWVALLDPRVSPDARKAALDKVLVGDELARNFVRVLVDNRRIEELSDTVAAFQALVQAQEQQLDVRITTAVELDAALLKTLEEKLSSTTGATVRLHPSVDPEIIGGLVVQHGDNLVDASLRGRLDDLKLTLSRGSLASTHDSEDSTTPRTSRPRHAKGTASPCSSAPPRSTRS
jgi:F-type H+-transporting ATPase subunit delta